MAASIETPNPPLFVGEFEHAIDGKNRITIPSEWRFHEEAEFFLMPNSNQTFLKVMPRQEMNRIIAKADTLTGQQRRDFLDTIGAGSRRCVLDKAGRIVVPPDFAKDLRLSGNVMLVGAMQTFNIWNRATWGDHKSRTRTAAMPNLEEFGL